MNEPTALREAGPGAPALRPAARSAARAALLEEIGRSRTTRRRVRLPGRRTSLRLGAALVAVAAAWTTAAVVTPEAPRPAHDAPAVPGGPTVADVRLVAFDMPVAPLALPTPPPGTTGPVLGASGNGDTSMAYTGSDDPQDRLSVTVGRVPLEVDPAVSGPIEDTAVTVAGRPGRLVVMNPDVEDARTYHLDWERTPGQWVVLTGQGRFADGGALVDLGASLVDSPRSIPVRLHLAPAGYSLDFLEDGGRIVRLADDADPARTRGLTVLVPLPGEDAVDDPSTVPGAGPVEQVTVQGQPASLVRVDEGASYEPAPAEGGWVLQARFPDGTAFRLEAPGTLTREEVLAIADQVTWTP